MVESRTSGKLALREENKEKYETATWKGRLLSSWTCCQNFIKATRSHISHIHIPEDTWEWLQSLSFSYLLSVSPRTSIPELSFLTPCELHLAWTVLLTIRASLEIFLISKLYRQREKSLSWKERNLPHDSRSKRILKGMKPSQCPAITR